MLVDELFGEGWLMVDRGICERTREPCPRDPVRMAVTAASRCILAPEKLVARMSTPDP